MATIHPLPDINNKFSNFPDDKLAKEAQAVIVLIF
jgi:hypothetical protein